MIKINLYVVGNLKEKYLKDAENEYLKRLSRYCKISVIEVKEAKIISFDNQLLIKKVLDEEAENILSRINENEYLVLLDLHEQAKLNPIVAGMSAYNIAKNAGFEIPSDNVIIAVKCKSVGVDEIMSREKLSPVLAYYKVEDEKEGFKKSEEMLEFFGLGHSAAIHCKEQEMADAFGENCKALRIIWNSPSTFGGIGNVYNSFLPSLTLGCGSYGHNSIGGNVSAINLLNIKKVGKRRNNMLVLANQ